MKVSERNLNFEMYKRFQYIEMVILAIVGILAFYQIHIENYDNVLILVGIILGMCIVWFCNEFYIRKVKK